MIIGWFCGNMRDIYFRFVAKPPILKNEKYEKNRPPSPRSSCASQRRFG